MLIALCAAGIGISLGIIGFFVLPNYVAIRSSDAKSKDSHND